MGPGNLILPNLLTDKAEWESVGPYRNPFQEFDLAPNGVNALCLTVLKSSIACPFPSYLPTSISILLKKLCFSFLGIQHRLGLGRPASDLAAPAYLCHVLYELH